MHIQVYLFNLLVYLYIIYSLKKLIYLYTGPLHSPSAQSQSKTGRFRSSLSPPSEEPTLF